MTMSPFQVMCLKLTTLHYLAGWASGALPNYTYTGTNISTGYQYKPTNVYTSMTDAFEALHIGNIDLPPCIKNLLNCWEMLSPDVLCKFNQTSSPYSWDYDQVNMDSICMDLRFQCREYTGNKPFPKRDTDVKFDICDDALWGRYQTWIKYP